MEGPNQMSPEAFVQQMRQRMEHALRQVAKAVNDAPDGQWINASEMQVFEEFNDLRREVYEKAVQMRADAAASVFSPGGPADRPAQGQQGTGGPQHAQRQRAGGDRANALAQPGKRRGFAGGPPAG